MVEIPEITNGKIILFALITITLWTIAITTFAPTYTALPYSIQFILLATFSYLLPSLILGITSENTIKKTISNFLFITAVDLIVPPLLVNTNGDINNTTYLGGGSIDIFLATTYQTTLHITGPLLFILTYPISFIILITISTYLETGANILKEVITEFTGGQ